MKLPEEATEKYLQCPYCTQHESKHGVRVPNTVGRFRVKIIYDSILIFTCRRCNRNFRMEADSNIILWHTMSDKERKKFRTVHYTKCKGGQKTK